MGKRTLEDMVAAQGYSPEVADAVIEDVMRHGTEEHIVSGASVLPHPEDAHHWHARKKREEGGRQVSEAPPGTVQALHDRIAAMEERLQQATTPQQASAPEQEG